MLEVIKSAPQDENQKELTTIVANLKCLLDWFRQEEKSFIDLKEIGEIANRNTNTIGAPLAQDFPVFNTEEEAISSMAFIDLINNLRLGISYFDMIIKRYESLIEAYQVFQLKKDEYQKIRNQGDQIANSEKERRQELLQYIDNTKHYLAQEKDMIVLNCKADMAMVVARLQEILERLNAHVQAN